MRLLSVHRVRRAGCCKDQQKTRIKQSDKEIRNQKGCTQEVKGLGENSASNARKNPATMGMTRRGAFAFENLNKF